MGPRLPLHTRIAVVARRDGCHALGFRRFILQVHIGLLGSIRWEYWPGLPFQGSMSALHPTASGIQSKGISGGITSKK